MRASVASGPCAPCFTDETVIRVLPHLGDQRASQAAAALRPALGFPALGILMFLLTCGPFPNTFRIRDLVDAAPDGPAVVRAALRELYAAGYLTAPRTRGGSGAAEVLVRRGPMARQALIAAARGENGL